MYCCYCRGFVNYRDGIYWQGHFAIDTKWVIAPQLQDLGRSVSWSLHRMKEILTCVNSFAWLGHSWYIRTFRVLLGNSTLCGMSGKGGISNPPSPSKMMGGVSSRDKRWATIWTATIIFDPAWSSQSHWVLKWHSGLSLSSVPPAQPSATRYSK